MSSKTNALGVKIFVCRICGEVYIGKDIPPSCPFCGVANKYLRLAKAWQDENDVELSELSRKNLEIALELEIGNSEFYKAVSKKAEELEVRLMFKGLFKVEKEHAEVFAKLLKTSMPEIKMVDCPANRKEIINDSIQREKRAVKLYAKFIEEAKEPRIKEVFEAIMNVEKDHVELDEEKIK